MRIFQFLLAAALLVHSIDSKLFNFKFIEKRLAHYNSTRQSFVDGRTDLSLHSESVYFPPRPVEDSRENDTLLMRRNLAKRGVDTTFHGRPKTKQEVWANNFNLVTHEFSQGTSLIMLLTKTITKYLGACIPIILYDEFVEQGEGFILQRLFQQFPTTFMHGKIGSEYVLKNPKILNPSDSKCRSYILFVADALKTRKVIGPQTESKVIVIPRSTQWKLQEFLASPLSRDIINLLVVGESYSADKTKDRPYVLYTHTLYVDGLGNNKPKVLTSWMKEKLSRPHVNLFPLKLTKGFAGHRFSIGAAHFPPFIIKKLSTDMTGNIQIKWLVGVVIIIRPSHFKLMFKQGRIRVPNHAGIE